MSPHFRAHAVVFDFDGTIIDTETPVYESWAEAYRFAGAEPIHLSTWLQSIGQAEDKALDLRAILCERLALDAMPEEVEQRRLAVRDEMLADLPLRDGVIDWIQTVAARGTPLAIASSSPTTWVQGHLDDRGLAEYFPIVSCADPGIAGKPDPTVYLTACRELDIDPTNVLAIEDSTHGVSAAVAAGLACIAVPGPITRTMDFDHATVRIDSLASLDAADWLAK